MKLYKSNEIKLNGSLALSLLVAFPWLFISYGGVLNSSDSSLVLSFFAIGVSLFLFFVFIPHNQDKNDGAKCYGNLYGKTFYRIIILLYLVVIIGKFALAYKYNFQLGKVRAAFFDAEGVNTVYFGYKYFGAIFSKIIVPLSLVLMIIPTKELKTQKILFFVFLISNVLVGGRFAIYQFVIILLLNNIIAGKVLNKNLFGIFLLLLFSFFLIANRLGVELFDSMRYLWEQVVNYHIIQIPLISSYSGFHVSLGPLTGIDSVVYNILGKRSPETLIAEQLNNSAVYLYNGDGPFNAFGTSLSYFYPLFGIPVGTIIFILSIFTHVGGLLVILKKNSLLVIKIYVFIIYFSAFQPYMFSFQYYMLIIFFILSFVSINMKKKSFKITIKR